MVVIEYSLKFSQLVCQVTSEHTEYACSGATLGTNSVLYLMFKTFCEST